VYDNGSFDEELEKLGPVFSQAVLVHKAGKNMGVAHAFNTLIHEAVQRKYDLIVLMGNDIENHPAWLAKMWQYSQAIPNSGLIALNWGCGANPIERKIIKGLEIDACAGVFGVTAFTTKVIETIGYFCEDYYPYGLEDGDYSIRAHKSGLINYYLPGIQSVHICNDVGEGSAYRRMKDESLARNLARFSENIAKYDIYNHYYIGYGNVYEPPLNPAE